MVDHLLSDSGGLCRKRPPGRLSREFARSRLDRIPGCPHPSVIENAEHRPGIGTKRNASDFATLKRYADGLEADVVALQEIGTVDAAKMLFPAPEFTVIPSEQLAAATTAGGSEDIYTAIVIRNRDDLTLVKQEDLNDLAVIHAADGRPVRSGTAVLLDLAGTELWILAVHLKSSCPKVKSISTSIDADCVTRWSQRVPLRDWIGERETNGEAFAIMGDFNRQFRRFGADDQLWHGADYARAAVRQER